MTPQAVPGGGVEQDPEQLWESVCAAGREAVARAGAGRHRRRLRQSGRDRPGLGSHHGPSRSARPSRGRTDGPRRSAPTWPAWPMTSPARTGLPLDPYFAAPKMTWLRRNVTTDGVVTTSDAWLLHRLTGSYVTDVTTASRTLLLDLATRTWSEEACAAFGLDAADLPEVVGCAQEIGVTDAFGPSLPVCGLSVDQQAALVGEHCLEPGESKCTYGTGAFLLANAGPRPVASSGGLAVSVAWQLGDAGRLLHRRAGLCRRCRHRLAAALGLPATGRGARCRRRLGRRQRRACTWCRPSAAWAPRGGNPTPSPALRASAPAPSPPMWSAPPWRVWPRRSRSWPAPPPIDLGRPLALLRGRRRPDAFTGAHADAGRPAAGSRRGRRLAPCHRGRRGRAGPARGRRRTNAR